VILKVLAYITRLHNNQPQLLVFDHCDHPEAGTQVPAGTVEPNESIKAALFREIEEESGLTNVRLIRKLAEYESVEWRNTRHVFHLAALATTPDSWAQTVGGQGEDADLVFNYYWIDLKPGLELADNQHQWLKLISTP